MFCSLSALYNRLAFSSSCPKLTAAKPASSDIQKLESSSRRRAVRLRLQSSAQVTPSTERKIPRETRELFNCIVALSPASVALARQQGARVDLRLVMPGTECSPSSIAVARSSHSLDRLGTGSTTTRSGAHIVPEGPASAASEVVAHQKTVSTANAGVSCSSSSHPERVGRAEPPDIAGGPNS